MLGSPQLSQIEVSLEEIMRLMGEIDDLIPSWPIE
jgi:hypothetical protein